jgi:uncharacterized integral membrane protein
MRFIQAVIFLVFLGAVGIFAMQNTGAVAVNFLSWSLTAPVAIVIVAVYFIGMLSGWSVVSFVRRSVRQIGEPPRR